MVIKDKCNHCFLVCNLRTVFKKAKFDAHHSLKPFIDLNGNFDPFLTALTRCSQTLSYGTHVLCILSNRV